MAQLGGGRLGTSQLGNETTKLIDSPATTVSARTPGEGGKLGTTQFGTSQLGEDEDLIDVFASGTVTLSADETVVSAVSPTPTVDPGSVTISAVESVLASSTPVPTFIRAIGAPVSSIQSVTPAPEVGYDEWTIADQPIGDLLAEIRAWDNMMLQFRTTPTVVTNDLSAVKDNAGDVDLIEKSDGTFTAVDRSSGNNTHTLKAPITRNDVRYKETWHSQEFDQKTIDQDGAKVEVTMNFAPDASKTQQTASGTVTKASDEWKFVFQEGEFATTRVYALQETGTKKTIGKEMVRLVLEPSQVIIMEESVRALNAVNVREVPDGDNLTEDNSDNTVNTVTVTEATNGSDILASGTYVVDDWETEWLNDDFYEVQLTLLES